MATDDIALRGRRVVVTRAVERAAPVAEALRRAGAEVVALPVVRTDEPGDGGHALATAAHDLAGFAWVVFTSATAVTRTVDACGAEALAAARLAAVGPATASSLAAHGLVPAVVAEPATAEGLVATMPAAENGARVLYPRAAGARDTVVTGLGAKGYVVVDVEVYRTVPVTADAPGIGAALRSAAAADAVTFTSPSTVGAYVALSPDAPATVVAACIGPVTADAARAAGFDHVVVAAAPTPGALVEALAAAFAPPTAGPGTGR